LSRINNKVLHLDVNDYYGSTWASFNINGFDEFMNFKNGFNPTNQGKPVKSMTIIIVCTMSGMHHVD